MTDRALARQGGVANRKVNASSAYTAMSITPSNHVASPSRVIALTTTATLAIAINSSGLSKSKFIGRPTWPPTNGAPDLCSQIRSLCCQLASEDPIYWDREIQKPASEIYRGDTASVTGRSQALDGGIGLPFVLRKNQRADFALA